MLVNKYQKMTGLNACFLICFICISSFALGQDKKPFSIDSSFHNSYYDAKEKIYQEQKNNKYDIVFFGNSITERGPWEELIGNNLKIGNRGIGGDNTFGMKARIADVVLMKPRKIFLMMGVNDISRNLSTDMILKNYEEIIRLIKNKSPKTKIYLQSTLPLNDNLLKYDYLKGKSQMILTLNSGIKSLAKKYRLVYVDLYNELGKGDVLLESYTVDGIHINRDGYVRWVDFLKKKKYL